MKTKSLILSALFAALITIGAFIKIPIPYLPFSLQVFFVNMSGLILGRKYGALAVIIYILIGLIGLPVFTMGGGIGYLLKPSFGYLLGFIPMAYVSGYITQKYQHKYASLLGGLIAIPTLYIVALPYFYFIFTQVLELSLSITSLLTLYFLVFLPGDLISIFIGHYLYQRFKRTNII